MATRKPASAAAINRAIDAMNRKANPSVDWSGEWSVPMNNGRRRIVRASKTGRIGEHPYSVEKVDGARRVTKNPGARNLAAPRKKPRENWPRFVVEEKEGVGPWMPRASFRILEDAENLARDIHRANPTIAVRVMDTKS